VLSTLVAVVNFSVTAICALNYFDLQHEHFPGHDCLNSSRKIAELELLTEGHWPQIFPRLMDVTN